MNNFPLNNQDQQLALDNLTTTSNNRKRKLENDENEAPDYKMPMNFFSNFANMIDSTGNGGMNMYNAYPNYSNTLNLNLNTSENQSYLQNYNIDNSILQYQNTQNYQGFSNQLTQYQNPQFPNFDAANLFNGSLIDSSYSSNRSNHYLSSTDSGLGTSGSQALSQQNSVSSEAGFMLGVDIDTETTGIEVAPQDTLIKYDEVLGRLALLNSNIKHPVSLAEVKRRLGKPEGMNSSYFGGYMRKAKNKNGGQKIKEQLAKYGITIPSGKRRHADPTAFTALTESETNTLVEDFHDLNRRYFPHEAFLQQVIVEFSKMENQIKYDQIRNQAGRTGGMLDHVKFWLDLCANVMSRDRSVYEHRGLPPPPNSQPLMPSLQYGLDSYNRITHDFGGRTCYSMLQTLIGKKADDPPFEIDFLLAENHDC